MLLTHVSVQGYRTFVDATEFDLESGMNVLTGRNNCGKSNLLSAITLAMNPESGFDKLRDTPSQMSWSVPKITLDFEADYPSSPEKTLLRYAQTYEEAAGSRQKYTLASQDRVQFVVEYRNGIRQEYFQAAGVGARRLAAEDERLQKLLTQFRRTIRYVFVRSGESLDSLLNGRFRDILHLVLKDHLRQKIEAAEAMRTKYVEDLQQSLLSPLENQIRKVVASVFPDIVSTSLTPRVPGLEETLADMQIELEDRAQTDLHLKGTGVRGGVLLALLKYLAEQSRRSIIFAVEEPEAFLHPGAQEELRDGLDELASGNGTTLLVTTHSPFIVSRNPDSLVIALSKDVDGRTRISATATGSTQKASVVSDLFRDPGIGDLLIEAMDVSAEGLRAILVVEGTTDEQYLRVAAEKTDNKDMLDGVRIVSAHGAEKLVLKTILLKNRVSIPVIAMLDHDDIGRSCVAKLVSIGHCDKGADIITLGSFGFESRLQNIEAEDLWPPNLLRQFHEEHGERVLSEKTRIGKTDRFRYGLSADGKEIIGDWLGRHATQADCVRWVEVLNTLATRVSHLTKKKLDAASADSDPQ